jgi:hypothetical protein
MGAAVAAVIMMRERQIVDAFRQAGATSAETARPLDSFGVDTDGVGMRRLRDRAVIRESHSSEGLFYVDVEVWQAVRRQRRRLALVIIVIGLAIALSVGLTVSNR